MPLLIICSYRDGDAWKVYGGLLKDISVGGKEIWGVNSANKIYSRTLPGSWVRFPGALIQVIFRLILINLLLLKINSNRKF